MKILFHKFIRSYLCIAWTLHLVHHCNSKMCDLTPHAKMCISSALLAISYELAIG